MNPTFALVVFVAFVSSVSAQSLTLAQKSQIRKVGLVAYVPSWLPKGFNVKSLSVEKNADPMMRGYTISYSNGKGGEFFVQAASEGLGDAMFTIEGDGDEPTGTMKVSNRALGSIDVELYFKGKHKQFHNQWLELKGKSNPRHFMIYGSDVGKEDIKKIYRSLVVVK